jgi:FMN-dependent NADH-azoreductase
MRKTSSYGRELSDKLIKKLTNEQHTSDKNSKVTIRDLAEDILLIDESWIKANFIAVDERTTEVTLSVHCDTVQARGNSVASLTKMKSIKYSMP